LYTKQNSSNSKELTNQQQNITAVPNAKFVTAADITERQNHKAQSASDLHETKVDYCEGKERGRR